MLKRHPSLDKASIMSIDKLLTPRQRLDLLEFFFVQHQPASNQLLRNSRHHRSQVCKRSSSLSDENFSTDESDNLDEHQKFVNINSDIMSLKHKRKASFAKSEPVSFVKLVNSNRLSMRNKLELDFQQMGSCSEENISLDDDSSSGCSIKASTKSSASGSNYDLEAYDTYASIPPVNQLKDGQEFQPASMDDGADEMQFNSASKEESSDLVSYQDQQRVSQILCRLLAEKDSYLPQSEFRSQSIKKAVSLSDLDKLAEVQAFKSTLHLDECDEITVTVPNLFTDFRAPFEKSQAEDDHKLVNLLQTDNGLLEFCPSEFDQQQAPPEQVVTNHQPTGQLFDFTHDDLQEILDQLDRKRQDEESEEELEMRSNWRKYLEKKSRQKRFRDELDLEDDVDAFAYLNEIEMNMDYFQSELQELYAINASFWDSGSMCMDTMLTFKSNRDAFNLRSYHNEIELQRQLQTAFENGEYADYDYEFEYECEYECNYDYTTYEQQAPVGGGGDDNEQEYEYQFEMEQESDSSVNSASGAAKKSGSGQQQQQLQMSVKPCVFKLNEGQCLKPDCRFAHDFEHITCKYWLDGVCFKGDTCEFYHGIVEQDASVIRLKHQSRNRSSASFSSSGKASAKRKNKSRRSDSVENTKSAKQLEQEFKLEMEEFPPLGS